MRLGLMLWTIAFAFGCERAAPVSDSSTVPSERRVIAEFSLWLDWVQPPVKVAEGRLIRIGVGKATEIDGRWWESALREDSTGVMADLQRRDGVGGFLRDRAGWSVSPHPDGTLLVDLNPGLVDHNLILRLRPDGQSTWGIATDAGETRLGWVEISTIDWEQMKD